MQVFPPYSRALWDNAFRWAEKVDIYPIDPQAPNEDDGYPLPLQGHDIGPSGPHVENLTITENVRAGLGLGLTKSESLTLTDAVSVLLSSQGQIVEQLLITEFVQFLYGNLLTKFESLTITDAVFAELIKLLSATPAAETLTITENVKAVLSPMVIRAHETLTITEGIAGAQGLLEVAEQLRITEYVKLAFSQLVVRVHENLAITEGGLNATGGASASLGPGPSPTTPPGGGLQDYWTVGI